MLVGMKSRKPETRAPRAVLEHALEHAAHLLPIQGPIGVFIHHNTLHAFQHLPFEEAVVAASELFGTEPYMREEQFRDAFAKGRITPADIEGVLQREPNAEILPGRLDRRALRRLMLHPGVRRFDAATIRWELEEGGLLEHCRPEAPPADKRALTALWYACVDETRSGRTSPEPRMPLRPRDGLLALTGIDLDSEIHPLLIRLAGAYLDQGMAYWPMPGREDGFYVCVRSLLMQRGAVLPALLRGLEELFRDQALRQFTAEEAALECLLRLGVPAEALDEFVAAELLALAGWAGLFRRLEEEPSLAPHEVLPCSLMDFLAVRLTATVAAVSSLRLEWRVPAAAEANENQQLCAAATLFDVAQLAGLQAGDLLRLDRPSLKWLLHEIEAFHEVERRRVFQLAYELWHERSILGPLASFRRMQGTPRPASRPAAQVFFCLDEREESLRRHLEEFAPDVETLGAAGYFGIAVNYRGIDDAHGVSLCPVVVTPEHAIRERPVEEDRDAYRRRRKLRALWARVTHSSFVSSRTLVRGALSTAALGLFSLFPLIARVLTPRHYSRFVNALNGWILPEPRTELTLMRQDPRGHSLAENLLLGFAEEEKAERVASVLGPAGLTERFAPIVVILGHGSTSLNNPHESAHDCGACGGRRGGPNARLFAAMANRPGVRESLRGRGIDIPESTWFVGGYHDTCSDEIEYFDLENMPPAFAEGFATVRKQLEHAREMDAHERARRFKAAPLGMTPAEALWHVQERSEHLAEPRPEYGHCTNAVCLVGRREISRGLFFDRRAFLVSYDPASDAGGENLGVLLGAAVPVCAGISLEYYFSFVDNEGYGCGTKLPHNISGLMGVMNGHASDLRTGLPWQMVEIHEPVRVLFVVESTPALLETVIGRSSVLHELMANRWIRLSTVDPDDGCIHVWRDGCWELQPEPSLELPSAPSSRLWYERSREHLPVARIGA